MRYVLQLGVIVVKLQVLTRIRVLQALAQRDTLQKQNDQLHAARTTSAEQSRDDQLAQYEARLRGAYDADGYRPQSYV